MRKLTLLMVLLLVVGVVGFVIGGMAPYSSDGYNHDVEVYVGEGWNLILAPDFSRDNFNIQPNSEIFSEDIRASWLYIPHLKDYIQLHPNNELSEKGPTFTEENEESVLQIGSAWIFSDKKGYLRYRRVDVPKIDQVLLLQGWNFMTVTPDMQGETLTTLEGNCNIEKAYGWNVHEISGGGDWDKIYEDKEFSGLASGKGFVIKVSDDCVLNSDYLFLELDETKTFLGKKITWLGFFDSESGNHRGLKIKVGNTIENINYDKIKTIEGLSIEATGVDTKSGKVIIKVEEVGTGPPGLPSGSETCVDSDGGIDYGVRGENEGTYKDPLTNEERDERVRDVCLGDPETSQSDIDYYLERGFISEPQAENENVLIEYYCVGGYIELNNYECPNGCSNGVCIE